MMNNFIPDASSLMTVVSFITFIGIVWWAYIAKRSDDFNEAALLPFADKANDMEKSS